MLITLSSAKGAPGVTTTALALALTWSTPVLVIEADVAGSSILPGAFRGQIPYTHGLVPMVGREISVAELRRQTIPYMRETLSVLPGIQRPSQAPALTGLWGQLTDVLKAFECGEVDVLVDMGRSRGLDDERASLVRGADLNVLVTSSRLPDIAVTRELARRMPREEASEALTSSRLLVVGPGRPYTAGDIARQVGLPLLESIGWDPVSAEHLSVGTPASRRFETSSLVRSAHAAAEAARAAVTRRRSILGQES